MSHGCPAPRCPQSVSSSMLACRGHWYSIPRALRDAVWAAWRNGDGAGTPEHRQAIDAAIAFLRGQDTRS